MSTKSKAGPNPDQLDIDGATGWTPEPGDKIEGTLLSVKASNPTDWGNGPKVYPIATIVTDSGELVAIHCFHTVLKNRLLEYRPTKGEKVAIKYVGEKQGKKNDRPYHSYSVVMPDRPEVEDTNWDAFSPDSTEDIPA